jgi:sigma-E factor negative regulatory protein RseA
MNSTLVESMMKSRLSALMDGELDEHECEDVFRALRRDNSMSRDWQNFHLIGDVLRGERGLETDITARVLQRLAQEPTVLAPSVRPIEDRLRPLLALAASAAGVAVVAWVGFGNPESPAAIPSARVSGVAELAALSAPALETSPSVTKPMPSERLLEYLVAHEAYAPTATVASRTRHVRTVSMERRVP